MSSETELVRLRCEYCGGKLTGQNNSKIFFCRSCRKSFDVYSGDSGGEDFFFASPFLKRELSMVYFPFQRIDANIRLNIPGENDVKGRQDSFLIPLFFIKNINYFGDIGYYYFLKDIRPLEGTDRGIPVFPADRNFKDVKPYPEIYLMQRESEKRGIDTFTADVKVSKSGIVMIPFFKQETNYYDSYLFWKYPSGALI